MKVLLETSPLRNANAIRGVGVYTKFLSQELEKLQNTQDEYFTSEDIGLEQFNAFMSKKGIDIIHYPYFNLFQQTLPLPAINQFLGRSSQKVVVTIHDVIPLLYPTHYPVGIAGNVGLFLQKQALKSVAAVITDSQTSKQDITRYLPVPQQKITAIPLAGNPEIKKSSAHVVAQIRKRYDLPNQYLLYVGDINYNKNIPELVKALALVDSNIHLVCVGANFKPLPIPEWKAIEVQLSSVSNRVHFITNVPKEDTESLSAIYTAAEAYVQPSLYEGFGLPLLEAMQCGTQVISSNTPALLEIGGNGVEFVGLQHADIANGIKRVINLSSAEKNKRVALNNETLYRFSWKKAAQETVQVYRNIL
ncbi:MAG: glycosyltransferase family 1 protein [Patescibacteria group bacterium]